MAVIETKQTPITNMYTYNIADAKEEKMEISQAVGPLQLRFQEAAALPSAAVMQQKKSLETLLQDIGQQRTQVLTQRYTLAALDRLEHNVSTFLQQRVLVRAEHLQEVVDLQALKPGMVASRFCVNEQLMGLLDRETGHVVLLQLSDKTVLHDVVVAQAVDLSCMQSAVVVLTETGLSSIAVTSGEVKDLVV
jgi:hypothetical protein